MAVSAIEEQVRELISGAVQKLSPKTFLSSEVRQMEREDLEVLAVAYLLGQVKIRQRAGVATIEREAVKKVPNRHTKAWYAWLETPEGSEAKAHEIQMQTIDQEAIGKMWNNISDHVRVYTEAMRMEWTDELLRSEFARGDGTKVSWGNATREDHAARVEMHKKNAVAGIEGASRHMKAIEELDAHGALSLNESLKIAA